MASAIQKIHTEIVPLGSAPVGTSIIFKIHDGTGFEARAVLLLETLTLATWKSSEIIGIRTREPLGEKGFYTLKITCPFTSKSLSKITIDVSLSNSTVVRQVEFNGKAKEVARLIADVFIK